MTRAAPYPVWVSALVLALGLVGVGTGEATHSGVDAPPLVVAQLAPIGNVEHATGTLVIRRADGRIDQGTDQLAVIDTGTGRVIGQVAVGLKPVGVAASR